MAARLCGLLNPILRSHKVYGSSLNYSTTLKEFSGRFSVKDNKYIGVAGFFDWGAQTTNHMQ